MYGYSGLVRRSRRAGEGVDSGGPKSGDTVRLINRSIIRAFHGVYSSESLCSFSGHNSMRPKGPFLVEATRVPAPVALEAAHQAGEKGQDARSGAAAATTDHRGSMSYTRLSRRGKRCLAAAAAGAPSEDHQGGVAGVQVCTGDEGV